MLDFLLKSSDNGQLKGFKVTDIDRNRKFGIAANSLRMLKSKASAKFKIENARLYLAKDGTEILDEEYFNTIAPQTVIVIAGKNDLVKTDSQLLYDAIRSNSRLINSGNAIREFIYENRHIFKMQMKACRNTVGKTQCLSSTREDDSDWFKGQPTNLNTKEKVMFRRSQDRVRGYLYKTKDELINASLYKSNKKAREIIDLILEIFKHLLTGVDYFGTYFDRKCTNRHPSVMKFTNIAGDDDDNDTIDSGETPRKKLKENLKQLIDQNNLTENLCVSLCTEEGDFICQGIWNRTECIYDDHTINPYVSRENAILFQSWNLDHQIEISRSILPSLIEQIDHIISDRIMCTEHKRRCVNVSVLTYFFEIFTIKNLKFVHIVCHDKGAHELKSNGYAICEKCEEYTFLKQIMKLFSRK